MILPSKAKPATQPKKAAEIEKGLFWGGQHLPFEAGPAHFCVLGGADGSATLVLQLLMQSALGADGEGQDRRALIYDANQTMLSRLAGMGLEGQVLTLNPLVQRGAAWDIAKDVTTPAFAHEVATLLVGDPLKHWYWGSGSSGTKTTHKPDYRAPVAPAFLV